MSDPRYKSVLHGCLDNLPTLNSRLVRIFISSTFTDTREERNVLLEDVYPKLKVHCKEKYGMDFQLVDMRWGVPVELADDHQATQLCLQEIRNCQKLSTGPNFVTFLNQKHGFRPLQVNIAEKEFEHLVNSLKENGHDTAVIDSWYKKDCNQVPPVYVLQPISSNIPGYRDKDNKEAKSDWNEVYIKLRAEFKFASDICHQKQLISEDERHKYYMSVTEAEIISGILNIPDSAADHCLCFIRIIEDMNSHLEHEKASRFIDVAASDPKSLDSEAQTILSQLRDEKIVRKLQDANISRNTVQWSEKDGINRHDHNTYLQKFKESFFTSMVAKIEEAVHKERSLIMDELYIEVLQHLHMANERCAMFHGREEILCEVKCYLQQQMDDPLILLGQSGCGKTSLMAETARLVPTILSNAVVVLRFLGTSPESSNLRRLLHSLCEQIVLCYGKDRTDVPNDFEDLKHYFVELLTLATKEKPLVVILDSLDQLSRDHNAYKLYWLPRKLPQNVKFFVSTYTVPSVPSELLGTLTNKFQKHSFNHVQIFSQELSVQVLNAWLTKNNRTLTDEQSALVVKAFVSCSLPLFVKLTYDQVLVWRSYAPLDECTLSNTIQQSIETLFSQLEKKHGVVLVTRALAYVTASQTGISETELEDLLSLDDDVLTHVYQIHIPPLRRIPPLLWVRIRHDISQYLVDKEVDEVRCFFWYHRQFYETAEKRYLADEAFKQETHSLMADYYLGKWHGVNKPFCYTAEQMKRAGVASPDGEADRGISAQPMIYSHDEGDKNVRYNKRKFNKLPYHLFEANRRHELRSVCLINLEWNQRKLKAVSLQELLLDLTMFGEKEGILHKAIKASQSTLSKFPETLAMEISGRLLALLQVNAKPDEIKLLEDSMKACAQQGKLVPCYVIPSESEMYAIENSRVPVCPYISPISSDSAHFATLSEENDLLIWDLASGGLYATINLMGKDDGALNVISKPPRKDIVIIGTTQQTKSNPVFIVDLCSCEMKQKLELEKKYTKIDDLSFDITDDHVVVSVSKQCADVFDMKSGKLLHEFDGNPDRVILIDKMILLHPKQSSMYTIYKMDTFEFVYQISCSEIPSSIFVNEITDIGCIVLENTEKLQMVCLDHHEKLGQILQTIDLTHKKGLKIQRVQIQGNVCLITSLEGFLLWDMKSRKLVREISVPTKYMPRYTVLEFESVLTPDSAHIIAGYDKYLIMFSVKTGELVHAIEATKSRIIRMHISPCGEYIVTTNSRNNHVVAWNVSSLLTKARSYQPLSMSNSARYMCMNRCGTTAVVCSMNPTEFAVVDIASGEKRCEISQDYEAMMPYVTEDGKYAALREHNSDSCLKIWDTYSGKLISTLPVSSLNLKEYVLGTKPENMVILTESENTGECMLTFCTLPSGKETGVKIPFGKFNMQRIFFAQDDKYLIVGIEELLHPGVKFYSKAFDVQTGDTVRVYEKMHPKQIQMITPESACFLGQHIHTKEDGKDSWETVMLNIETGDTMVTFNETTTSTLFIGWEGCYGIDRNRNVFNIKQGRRCGQFDPHLGEQENTVPIPKLSKDEKFAFWLDTDAGLVKVGSIETWQMIGMSPIHSIPMNMEVTPEKIVLIGCEDGRIMMLQMINVEKEAENMFSRVFQRTKKKALKCKESTLKAIYKGKKEENNAHANKGKNNSKVCRIQ